ncbi:MAG: cyclic nucleotide-binding domain-containing protein [Gammaproteobacteria bacterium]|nr:cyclic nucleotide-binding domain-containing protein [Gammaproteobacteria bacterium]
MTTANTSSIWGTLFRKPVAWHQQVASKWAKTPFFSGIPLKEIEKLSKNMHLRTFQADEYIFHNGDQGAGAAIILSGEIEIRVKKTVLAQLSEGDFFGEVSLVLDERRTADAIALTNCELAFFLRPELEEWTQRVPHHASKLTTNLARVLAHRLLHANQLLAQRRSR